MNNSKVKLVAILALFILVAGVFVWSKTKRESVSNESDQGQAELTAEQASVHEVQAMIKNIALEKFDKGEGKIGVQWKAEFVLNSPEQTMLTGIIKPETHLLKYVKDKKGEYQAVPAFGTSDLAPGQVVSIYSEESVFKSRFIITKIEYYE